MSSKSLSKKIPLPPLLKGEKTFSRQDNRQDSRKILRRLYKDVWAFTIPRPDEKRIKKAKSSSLYGEITYGAVEKLLDYLKLKPSDTFFDLGSGAGKVVMQVAMNSPVKKAIGIELSKTRYDIAIDRLEEASAMGFIKRNRCEFWNEDILKANLKKATVIYTCSTAFSQPFMNALTEKLSQLKTGLIVVSMQEFPERPEFQLIEILRLDMTWVRRTQVYIYELIKP